MGESPRWRRILNSRRLILLMWLLLLGLAGWSLQALPWHAMLAGVLSLSPLQWIGWIAVNTVIILLLTWRWLRLGQRTHGPLGLGSLLLIRHAGQTVSFITPGPQFGGEPLQLFWLCRRHGVTLHNALLALSLDRAFEIVVNISVLLLGVCLLLTPSRLNAATWHSVATLLALLLVGVIFAVWLLLRRTAGRPVGWRARLLARWQQRPLLQRLHTFWREFHGDLRTTFVNEKPLLASAACLSLLAWAGLLAELALLLNVLDVPADFSGFVLLMVAMRLALLLPIPGGIGTLEAAVLWSFQHAGWPLASALGLIALFRLRDVMLLAAGFACLRALQAQPAPELPQADGN